MNIEQAYEKTNAVGRGIAHTPLTFEEAKIAVRKMYRHLTGRKFPYPIVETTGNRITWMRGAQYRVNVSNGWNDLIHLFSHWFHRSRIGGRPHSKVHARVERKLRKWALSRGWFTGALKRPEKEEVVVAPTRDEERAKLIEKRRAQVVRLERKIKALTTRLRRANRSLKALERFAAKAGAL